MKPNVLYNEIIIPSLKWLEPIIPYSEDAAKLLLFTAKQESNCGQYVVQLGAGPARGIFQVEPKTEADHIDWMTKYHIMLFKRVSECSPMDLVINNQYAVAISRIHYWRRPEALPDDVEGMAGYWKQWYNTPSGHGTINQFVANANTVIDNLVATT